MKVLANFGYTFYQLLNVLPTTLFAQINAAPTLTFLNSHLKWVAHDRKRIPSGVAHERFMVDGPEQIKKERATLLAKCGLPATDNACVILMVQRLAPEKGTIRCLEALAEVPRTKGQPLSLDGERPLHVVIAGDGPSRKKLGDFASQHDLPVTFVGNLPNTDLPPLYRAADLFVSCSTSETYGLTVVESLTCGTPVVLPHCGVFDELWVGRIPAEWMYDEGTSGALLSSLRHAGAKTSKAYLVENPIKASWQDATKELLAQYEEMIEKNMPTRSLQSKIISNLDSLARASLVVFIAYWLMRAYMGKVLKIAYGLADDLFFDSQ